MPTGSSAWLKTERGNPDLLLRIKHDYTIVDSGTRGNRYEAVTASYVYRILDLHEREILAFHWHPDGVSQVRHPHLHLTSRTKPVEIDDPANPDREPEQIAFAAMHIATGLVPVEHVIRLLIEEFKVVPLRPEWDDILNENAATSTD